MFPCYEHSKSFIFQDLTLTLWCLLSVAGLFKYAWPFCYYQALKSYCRMVSGSKRISAIGSELFLKVRWTQLSFQVLFDVKYCFIEMMIHGREKTSCVFTHLEADVQRCSIKKAFLQISQNTQKKTCVRVSFLVKLQAETCNFIKKDSLHVFLWILWNVLEQLFYRTPPVAASTHFSVAFI